MIQGCRPSVIQKNHIQQQLPEEQQRISGHDILIVELEPSLFNRGKPRVRWTVELHERFLKAVSKLGGLSVATPRRILHEMNVRGMNVDQIKSHLQKARIKKSSDRLTEETARDGHSAVRPNASVDQELPFNMSVNDLESYVSDINTYGKLLSNSEVHYNAFSIYQNLAIAAMTDSFISVPADHSEPSVGGPSSDPHPVVPPVLAILPPHVLQPVPLQAIPPPGMRPPIKRPPPADSDSTGHSVAGAPFRSTLHPIPYYQYEALLLERDSLLAQIRELQHIIKTTDVDRGVRELREEIHMTHRIFEARLHEATLPGRGPDTLMGWASEVMEGFERLGGPEFPWS
ncbi:hypothetical protein AgCh_035063 [Apium graveolens]